MSHISVLCLWKSKQPVVSLGELFACHFSLVCAALWRALHEQMLPGAPCLSYQRYLQMEQRRLKVIMKLEVFHHALVERVKRKRVQ